MRNYEREFVSALADRVRTLTFDIYDGTQEQVVDVAIGKFPERIPGYPFVLIAPLGPDWDLEVLGGGSRIARVTRRIYVVVELHYEHFDPEVGIYRMSDMFTQMVEYFLSQTNILDEESLRVVDTDYSYAVADKESQSSDSPDMIPEWGYKGVGTVTLEASWRYR